MISDPCVTIREELRMRYKLIDLIVFAIAVT